MNIFQCKSEIENRFKFDSGYGCLLIRAISVSAPENPNTECVPVNIVLCNGSEMECINDVQNNLCSLEMTNRSVETKVCNINSYRSILTISHDSLCGIPIVEPLKSLNAISGVEIIYSVNSENYISVFVPCKIRLTPENNFATLEVAVNAYFYLSAKSSDFKKPYDMHEGLRICVNDTCGYSGKLIECKYKRNGKVIDIEGNAFLPIAGIEHIGGYYEY